jgi:hypothetical protein
MTIGKSQFCDEYKFRETGFMALNAAIARIGVSAEKAAAVLQEFTQSIRKIIPKEYKIMELKLLKLETRLHVLEHRSTECEAIRKKLRRQIRNLKAAMAA